MIQLTSLHRGASAAGWEMGASRAGIVKSTIVKPPFLLPIKDWCLGHIGAGVVGGEGKCVRQFTT